MADLGLSFSPGHVRSHPDDIALDLKSLYLHSEESSDEIQK